MRLLRLSEMEPASGERVFANSRVSALLFVLALLLGIAGALIGGFKFGSVILYYIAGALLLILALFRDYVAAHFRSTNWLVRATSDGLFFKFRSYLNYRLPDDNPTVVFLAYTEIRSACTVRVRSAVYTQGGRSWGTFRFVEFEVAGDVAPLQKALTVELSKRGPREKHWYGTTSTLYNDYPLSIVAAPFLRLRWSARPGASVFLDMLRPHAVITEPVSVSEDFTDLEGLPRAEQEKRLKALDARGETITAIYMARRLFGSSLTDATKLVESLRLDMAAPT